MAGGSIRIRLVTAPAKGCSSRVHSQMKRDRASFDHFELRGLQELDLDRVIVLRNCPICGSTLGHEVPAIATEGNPQ